MCASAPPSMASGITAKSKQSFKGELSSGCETERVLRGCCCLLPSDAAAIGSHESLPPVGDRFSPFRGEMSPQVTKWGTGGCDRREQTNEGAPLDGANGCSPLIRHFVPPSTPRGKALVETASGMVEGEDAIRWAVISGQ